MQQDSKSMNQHNLTYKCYSKSDTCFRIFCTYNLATKCVMSILSCTKRNKDKTENSEHFTLHPHTTSLNAIPNKCKAPTSLKKYIHILQVFTWYIWNKTITDVLWNTSHSSNIYAETIYKHNAITQNSNLATILKLSPKPILHFHS